MCTLQLAAGLERAAVGERSDAEYGVHMLPERGYVRKKLALPDVIMTRDSGGAVHLPARRCVNRPITQLRGFGRWLARRSGNGLTDDVWVPVLCVDGRWL